MTIRQDFNALSKTKKCLVLFAALSCLGAPFMAMSEQQAAAERVANPTRTSALYDRLEDECLEKHKNEFSKAKALRQYCRSELVRFKH